MVAIISNVPYRKGHTARRPANKQGTLAYRRSYDDPDAATRQCAVWPRCPPETPYIFFGAFPRRGEPFPPVYSPGSVLPATVAHYKGGLDQRRAVILYRYRAVLCPSVLATMIALLRNRTFFTHEP